MKKKILYWIVGILIVVGIFSSFGNSTKPQVKETSTVVTSIPTFTPTNTIQPTQSTTTQDNELNNDNSYTNSSGNVVHSPANSNDGSVPSGATAQCGDGTYSFSQHRSGTCSHHGGVAQWL